MSELAAQDVDEEAGVFAWAAVASFAPVDSAGAGAGSMVKLVATLGAAGVAGLRSGSTGFAGGLGLKLRLSNLLDSTGQLTGWWRSFNQARAGGKNYRT